jgi:hypothetical protein
MSDQDLRAYREGVRARLDALLVSRYGRDGDAVQRGHSVSLYEAGLPTWTGWWALPRALDPGEAGEIGTSFQTLQLSTRLDLLFRDLLEYPDDQPDKNWAWRYGYRSSSALSRACRGWYDTGVGDIRRMGMLGRWLALVSRGPRSPSAIARRNEAIHRLEVFRLGMKDRAGPQGARALERLGIFVAADARISRPRYPRVGAAECRRLKVPEHEDSQHEAPGL